MAARKIIQLHFMLADLETVPVHFLTVLVTNS